MEVIGTASCPDPQTSLPGLHPLFPACYQRQKIQGEDPAGVWGDVGRTPRPEEGAGRGPSRAGPHWTAGGAGCKPLQW